MGHGHHFTPAEIGDMFAMTEEEVLHVCEREGVPVFHGRVDYTLFDAALRASGLDEHDQPLM